MAFNWNWNEEYKKKLVTADEAAKIVKSGDWVEYAFGVSSSCVFDEALSKRKNELKDINIRSALALHKHYTLEADPNAETFTWDSWHLSGLDRPWVGKGLYYIPMKFFEYPTMTMHNAIPINIFVVQVSPMDKHGYFSWGLNTTGSMACFETAQYCILEVNKNLPRVLGGALEHIHVTQVDYIIEADVLPPTLSSGEPGEVDKKIAGNIINRLRDRCCIQLGIGKVPDAVGTLIAASDLKDLGVHTEMYVDAYLGIAKAGKITGRYKNRDRYKQVFSFAYGSQELYDYIDDNPGVQAFNVDYTNDPAIIASIDNFVAINACVEVDLYGQVCSESIGTRHISGTGGQLDFVEGAFRSKGGQGFVCTPSVKTLKDGTKVSSIAPILTPGAIVTCPRTATHLIATEYGVADLKGKSTWERAEVLIDIAHPDFRDELIKQATINNIWRKSNK
ncbi:MAG: butyryl-CoA:acetate CoA-transferase [Leptospirales bacterium]|nr:butyryl-CoA:acetate CoA-transferase [Leptospirales bacterium]